MIKTPRVSVPNRVYQDFSSNSWGSIDCQAGRKSIQWAIMTIESRIKMCQSMHYSVSYGENRITRKERERTNNEVTSNLWNSNRPSAVVLVEWNCRSFHVLFSGFRVLEEVVDVSIPVVFDGNYSTLPILHVLQLEEQIIGNVRN